MDRHLSSIVLVLILYFAILAQAAPVEAQFYRPISPQPVEVDQALIEIEQEVITQLSIDTEQRAEPAITTEEPQASLSQDLPTILNQEAETESRGSSNAVVEEELPVEDTPPVEELIAEKQSAEEPLEAEAETQTRQTLNQIAPLASSQKLPLLVVDANAGSSRVFELDADGTEVWSYSVPLGKIILDAERLPNGNTLIATEENVFEVNLAGTITWQYFVQDDITSAERLDNGNTLLTYGHGDPNGVIALGGRTVEIDPNGNEVWSINTPLAHVSHRLANGNTLLIQWNDVNDDGKVFEVNPSGAVVWEYWDSVFPKEAKRLDNGNTLISDYVGVKEITPQKTATWKHGRGYGTGANAVWQPNDAMRLVNGNTIILDEQENRILEFTPGRQVANVYYDFANEGKLITEAPLLFKIDVIGLGASSPKTITGLQLDSATYYSVTVSWNDPTGEVLFDHVEIWVDGAWYANTTTSPHTVTGFFPDSTHEIKVRSVNTFGLTGPYSMIQVSTVSGANTAPSISTVGITPDPAYKTDTLVGSGTYADIEDNVEQGSTFAWYANSVLIAGATAQTLDASNFAKGDVIVFEYTPSDGQDTGTPVQSAAVTILNSIPTINSKSPSGNPSVPEGATQTFSIAVSDEDNDLITYEWRVDNVVQQGETSNIYSFVSQVGDAGIYAITATVSDNEATNPTPATWTFTIQDIQAPTLGAVSTTPEPLPQGGVLNLSIWITDNTAVETVFFEMAGVNQTPTDSTGNEYWFTDADTSIADMSTTLTTAVPSITVGAIEFTFGGAFEVGTSGTYKAKITATNDDTTVSKFITESTSDIVADITVEVGTVTVTTPGVDESVALTLRTGTHTYKIYAKDSQGNWAASQSLSYLVSACDTLSSVVNSEVDGTHYALETVTNGAFEQSWFEGCSYVTDSMLMVSNISKSTITNANLNAVTAIRSTILDSTLSDSYIVDSYIDPSSMQNTSSGNSTVIDSSTTNVVLNDSWIERSTLVNVTAIGAKVIDNILISGTLIYNGVSWTEPTTIGIDRPTNLAVYNESEDVLFNVSEQVLFTWTSDLDGVIGTTKEFTRNDLSIGTHIVTLNASMGGAYVTRQVTIQIRDNTSPIISNVSAGLVVDLGARVNVSATVKDNLGVAAVLFEVAGQNVTAAQSGTQYYLDNVSTSNYGTHTFTVYARDAAGNWASNTSSYHVNEPPSKPPQGGGGGGGGGFIPGRPHNPLGTPDEIAQQPSVTPPAPEPEQLAVTPEPTAPESEVTEPASGPGFVSALITFGGRMKPSTRGSVVAGILIILLALFVGLSRTRRKWIWAGITRPFRTLQNWYREMHVLNENRKQRLQLKKSTTV